MAHLALEAEALQDTDMQVQQLPTSEALGGTLRPLKGRTSDIGLHFRPTQFSLCLDRPRTVPVPTCRPTLTPAFQGNSIEANV